MRLVNKKIAVTLVASTLSVIFMSILKFDYFKSSQRLLQESDLKSRLKSAVAFRIIKSEDLDTQRKVNTKVAALQTSLSSKTKLKKREHFSDQNRTEILNALNSLPNLVGRAGNVTSLDDLKNTLFQYQSMIPEVIYDELSKDNSSGSNLDHRMVYIDTLGQSAENDSKALELLKRYITSEVDMNKDQSLIHKDFMDRLEAFEWLAAWDESKAVEIVNNTSNQQLKADLIYSFIIGLQLRGLDKNKATQITKNYFYKT